MAYVHECSADRGERHFIYIEAPQCWVSVRVEAQAKDGVHGCHGNKVLLQHGAEISAREVPPGKERRN